MAKTVRVTIRRKYNWIDKDPVIDDCMALAKRVGLQGAYHKIALLTGMSPSTFANWDKGGTKRPQHASIACFVEALGCEYVIQEKGNFNLEKELEAGRRWWKKNKPQKPKKKAAKKSRTDTTKLAA